MTDDTYFTPEHHAFRETVRRFVLSEMASHVDQLPQQERDRGI